jgi:uncharacterized protein with LGFP repeats
MQIRQRLTTMLAVLITLPVVVLFNPGVAHAALTYPCGTGWPGVYGGIGDHYYHPGIGEGLGCPTSWEYAVWDGNRAQNFQGGLMYWQANTGRAYATWGEIFKLWSAGGSGCEGLYGPLGPPTSDEHDAYWNGQDVRKSNFQNGSWITWDKRPGHAMHVSDRWGNYPC